jgi:signal transduction histidine kinase/ActR/RegA family two-component response regulator
MDRAVGSLATEPISGPDAADTSAIAGVVFPLLARGAVLGALALTARDGRVGNDAPTVALYVDVGGRAAIAVDNALLYREIQQRDVRKDEFVAMLAHELRNPLAALSTALGVLETAGARDEAATTARHVMARQLRTLAQLTDDLLDVARVTTGRITLNRSVVNFAEIADHCLSTFRAAGKTEGYAVEADLRETWVDADPTRLEQVVSNLLGNALKYTPNGGRVRLRVRPDQPHGVFEIEDSGIGMSPEVAAHAFDLFFQADQPLDRTQGGLGIGLALVRQLVELHGGTVEGTSAGKGRGSRFTVRLPLGQPVMPHAAGAGAAGDRNGTRIVLVEDNKDAREMLRVLLSLSGHEVYEAGDGPGAFELIRSADPAIALIDVGLPGYDGYELARRVRALPDRKGVYLVALTGYGQPNDRAAALAAGFDVHVVKPVDHHHLRTVIAAAQRRQGQDTAHRSGA